jgi:hypothetical protein
MSIRAEHGYPLFPGCGCKLAVEGGQGHGSIDGQGKIGRVIGAEGMIGSQKPFFAF